MDKYNDFLKSVSSFNDLYASIKIDGKLENLVMPFWEWSDIQCSDIQKEDWELEEKYIPFYGDWHDLICLNVENGQVIMLNDSRKVVTAWDSIDAFVSSLSKDEVPYESLEDIKIEASIDFETMMRKFKDQKGVG